MSATDEDGWMNDRTCIVLREAGDPDGLIRFVAAPDGTVTPDLKRKLPGRGVWVTGRRSTIEEAVRRKLFPRGLRREVTVPGTLAADIDRMLEDAALAALSLARKAGTVVTGFSKVESSIRSRSAIAVINASDGSPDGKRKLEQAAHSTYIGESGLPFFDDFPGERLDMALGAENVVHVGILPGGAGQNLVRQIAALRRFRELPG